MLLSLAGIVLKRDFTFGLPTNLKRMGVCDGIGEGGISLRCIGEIRPYTVDTFRFGSFITWFFNNNLRIIYKMHMPLTVLPAKSESDVIFCVQVLVKFNLYTPLKLTQIDRSLVY